MSVIYEQAEPEVLELAQDIINQYHPDLRDKPEQNQPGIRLCILMALTSADDDGPAVKVHGYPAYACVSIIPYKQRVDKRADVEIIVDAKAWEDLTDRRRRALLDHEITHVEVVRDSHGFIKTDDLGRPKLALKNHDWQLGGFRVIAQRYQEDAIDVIEAKKFKDTFGDVAMPEAKRESLIP